MKGILDFKLSPCLEYCKCSFGYLPGVRLWFADVSEPSVISIFKGWMWSMKYTPYSTYSTSSLWRWNWQRVPKRRQTTIWRRGDTQNNIYNTKSFTCIAGYSKSIGAAIISGALRAVAELLLNFDSPCHCSKMGFNSLHSNVLTLRLLD